MNITRRNFLKNTAVAAAGLSFTPLTNSMAAVTDLRQQPKRVNLGVIGLGMGCRDLTGALTDNPWVHCIAMCDVNQERLNQQMEAFKKNFPEQTSQLKGYTDFRELLAQKDIQGVIIATPDHWHPYIYAEALKAGKDIYVEKPVGNSIAECNLMADLQKKYHRVVTTGLWQTSQRYFRAANEILKSGVLGDVYKIQTWLCQTTNPRAKVEDSTPPATLDYNMWLGPAPMRPYNSGRVRGWRGFWDYGGGQQTDWGVHWIDSALEGAHILGLCEADEYPLSVYSTAFKDKESFNETPSCQTTVFKFGKFHLEWTEQVAYLYNRNQGVAWIGNKATLVCNREGYELIPEKNRDGSTVTDKAVWQGAFEDGGIEAHATQWCQCIVDRSLETRNPIERAARSTIMAHLGNISYLTGKAVTYNPSTRRFDNNPEADSYLSKQYRAPWKMPTI